jgi:hypothetical protein
VAETPTDSPGIRARPLHSKGRVRRRVPPRELLERALRRHRRWSFSDLSFVRPLERLIEAAGAARR